MLKMSRRRIPETTRQEIVRLVDKGYTQISIAEELGVHRNTVSRVYKREYHLNSDIQIVSHRQYQALINQCGASSTL